MFARALNMGYAIGAFNTVNLETTQAIVWGAQKQQAPVIVQTSGSTLKYAGTELIARLTTWLAEEVSTPVVLHLDHGSDLDQVKECIEAGFTSVMIDASGTKFEDNMKKTKEVVAYAHQRGVWVEAELGAILGAEGLAKLEDHSTPDSYLTDPKQARQFVDTTEVDSLAISIGTIHGAFTGKEFIRFELIDAIQKEIPHLPLVMHGGSGLAEENLREVATKNICKINIDTDLRLGFIAAAKPYHQAEHVKVNIRKMLGPSREAVQAIVEKKIATFGSANQA